MSEEVSQKNNQKPKEVFFSKDETLTTGNSQSSNEELSALLAEAQAEAQKNWEQVLRKEAELQNLQRRTQIDIENTKKFALESLLENLLSLADNLERALQAIPEDLEPQQAIEAIKNLKEGTALTLKQFLKVLEKKGVKVLDPLGQTFDPHFHTAMSLVESNEHAPQQIIAVMQKGYLMYERLLRPATVIVCKSSEQDSSIK